MCSGMGDRTCLLPGFPIRTSPDQSSVDSSPGLFAASHVLHRLLVPRHPPCALTNLATKMLASTVQFSSYGRSRSLVAACRSRPCGAVRWFDGKAVHTWRSPRLLWAVPTSPEALVTEGSSSRSIPQDPTARLGRALERHLVPAGKPAVLDDATSRSRPTGQCSTLEPHPESVRLRPEFSPIDSARVLL